MIEQMNRDAISGVDFPGPPPGPAFPEAGLWEFS